jgi:hypothetical protein
MLRTKPKSDDANTSPFSDGRHRHRHRPVIQTMFSFFRRTSNVPFQTQLTELAKLGFTPAAEVTPDDWVAFHPLSDYEAKPYYHIIEALGSEIQRDDYLPMCSSLWMCDYERIEDHGAYREIIERLQLLSGSQLPISNISDFVDIEEGKAWVEFDLGGVRQHWDAKIDNDWMDPYIVVKFDELLRKSTELIMYSNHTDFGQSALFACMSAQQFDAFRKISRVKMDETRKQA